MGSRAAFSSAASRRCLEDISRLRTMVLLLSPPLTWNLPVQNAILGFRKYLVSVSVPPYHGHPALFKHLLWQRIQKSSSKFPQPFLKYHHCSCPHPDRLHPAQWHGPRSEHNSPGKTNGSGIQACPSSFRTRHPITKSESGNDLDHYHLQGLPWAYSLLKYQALTILPS